MLSSATQLKISSSHVVVFTKTTKKLTKMRNARAVRAKLLFFFFLIKYADLWCFGCRHLYRCFKVPNCFLRYAEFSENVPNLESFFASSGLTSTAALHGYGLMFVFRLHHTSSSLPKDKEQWEKFVFVDKTHWGYYSWPK